MIFDLPLTDESHRQIRNAFQTAIALAEYEARQPGAEIPSLGKSQLKSSPRLLRSSTGI
jgi:hypothetical protein